MLNTEITAYILEVCSFFAILIPLSTLIIPPLHAVYQAKPGCCIQILPTNHNVARKNALSMVAYTRFYAVFFVCPLRACAVFSLTLVRDTCRPGRPVGRRIVATIPKSSSSFFAFCAVNALLASLASRTYDVGVSMLNVRTQLLPSTQFCTRWPLYILRT